MGEVLPLASENVTKDSATDQVKSGVLMLRSGECQGSVDSGVHRATQRRNKKGPGNYQACTLETRMRGRGIEKRRSGMADLCICWIKDKGKGVDGGGSKGIHP